MVKIASAVNSTSQRAGVDPLAFVTVSAKGWFDISITDDPVPNSRPWATLFKRSPTRMGNLVKAQAEAKAAADETLPVTGPYSKYPQNPAFSKDFSRHCV
jgi:hypothetical protein